MTNLTSANHAFFFVDNVLYTKNITDHKLINSDENDLKFKFIKKNLTEFKERYNGGSSAEPSNKAISTHGLIRGHGRKDHGHGGHGHSHGHDHHDHHDDYHDHGHGHGHEEHHTHKHKHHDKYHIKGGCGGHGHKHLKHKGGHDHGGKKFLFPILVGLLTAKSIILPLVLKLLAFWSAKGLLLGLIATVMASILSLKKMIEPPHYKIEGKKDDEAKIEIIPYPIHDRIHHHSKNYEFSAEGAESQHPHPYQGYY